MWCSAVKHIIMLQKITYNNRSWRDHITNRKHRQLENTQLHLHTMIHSIEYVWPFVNISAMYACMHYQVASNKYLHLSKQGPAKTPDHAWVKHLMTMQFYFLLCMIFFEFSYFVTLSKAIIWCWLSYIQDHCIKACCSEDVMSRSTLSCLWSH